MFAYISYHHVPAQLYGLLFAIGIVGIMATNLTNSPAGASLRERQAVGLGHKRRRVGGRHARDRGPDRLGWACRAGRAAVPVHLGGRVRRRQLDRRRPDRLSRPGGCGLRLGGGDTVPQRHLWLGPGRCLRRRHALAHGLGDRAVRAGQPREHALLLPAPIETLDRSRSGGKDG